MQFTFPLLPSSFFSPSSYLRSSSPPCLAGYYGSSPGALPGRLRRSAHVLHLWRGGLPTPIHTVPAGKNTLPPFDIHVPPNCRIYIYMYYLAASAILWKGKRAAILFVMFSFFPRLRLSVSVENMPSLFTLNFLLHCRAGTGMIGRRSPLWICSTPAG